MSKHQPPPVPPAGRSNKAPPDATAPPDPAPDSEDKATDRGNAVGTPSIRVIRATSRIVEAEDMRRKSEAADRSVGGPGSSHQDATEPHRKPEDAPRPGQPTSSRNSRVSGGGGERDRHHSHNSIDK